MIRASYAGPTADRITRQAELALLLATRLDEGDWVGRAVGRVNEYTPTVCSKEWPGVPRGNGSPAGLGGGPSSSAASAVCPVEAIQSLPLASHAVASEMPVCLDILNSKLSRRAILASTIGVHRMASSLHMALVSSETAAPVE